MNHWTAEQLKQLVHTTDLYTLVEHLAARVQDLGFDYYVFTFVSPQRTINQNNCPGRWSEHYQCHGYAAIDPSLIHCQRSRFPLPWTAESFAAAPELWADAQAHGLCHGWTQPHHDDRGWSSSFSVLRRHGLVVMDELYEKAAHVMWLGELLHGLAATSASDLDHALDAGAPAHVA